MLNARALHTKRMQSGASLASDTSAMSAALAQDKQTGTGKGKGKGKKVKVNTRVGPPPPTKLASSAIFLLHAEYVSTLRDKVSVRRMLCAHQHQSAGQLRKELWDASGQGASSSTEQPSAKNTEQGTLQGAGRGNTRKRDRAGKGQIGCRALDRG